jgi:hypothetical protein
MIGTMVLGFLAAAAAAVAVTTAVFVMPGDTEGIAVIVGLVVFVVIIRAATHWMLDQAARGDEQHPSKNGSPASR